MSTSEYAAWKSLFPKEETLQTEIKGNQFRLIAVAKDGIEVSVPVENAKDRTLILQYDRLDALWELRESVKHRTKALTTTVNAVWKKRGLETDYRNESQYWALVCARERRQLPKPNSQKATSNPDWTRDELILALNVYLKHRPNPPGKGSSEIIELSRTLNRLGEKLFPPETRAATFRNKNGVYMKLMNFRRLDTAYTADGKTGLSRGAGADEAVWAEFAGDQGRCRHVAEAIMTTLDDPEVGTAWLESDIDEGLQEAAEGRLLTRKHLARERNRKLVESKRRQTMKRHGKLVCEACGFDFAISYGNRGEGFIECHHTKPLTTVAEGHKTHIDDLALVCANCHRIIHRGKPWLSVTEIKALVSEAQLKSGTASKLL